MRGGYIRFKAKGQTEPDISGRGSSAPMLFLLHFSLNRSNSIYTFTCILIYRFDLLLSILLAAFLAIQPELEAKSQTKLDNLLLLQTSISPSTQTPSCHGAFNLEVLGHGSTKRTQTKQQRFVPPVVRNIFVPARFASTQRFRCTDTQRLFDHGYEHCTLNGSEAVRPGRLDYRLGFQQ